MYAESESAGARETERIGILATPELDGTPVQCVIVPHNYNSNRFTREYSKFSIIRVNLNSNTTTYSNTITNGGRYCFMIPLIVLLRGLPCFHDFSHGASHPYIPIE